MPLGHDVEGLVLVYEREHGSDYRKGCLLSNPAVRAATIAVTVIVMADR
ncbi:hypothetical protein OG989_05635 [Micromonospora sp. NBC_01740]|nr:hypothetical protein OG989_05635 [Micromonospora sp. NBC_01740]